MSFYQKGEKNTIIMLEGNIGSGKSTFLRVIENHLSVDVIFEPTDKWQNKNDEENILDLFYRDTPRWAYTFQSYAFISRVQTLLEFNAKNKSSNPQVLERSVYCDRYCFAQNCYESGLMSPLEWQIYKEWFSWLVETYAPRPKGFIYLQTTPDVCFERINKRNRKEETGISVEYLSEIHGRHENWLVRKLDIVGHVAEVPVLILDCNKDFEHDVAQQKMHMQKVQEFIDGLLLPMMPVGDRKVIDNVNTSS